METREAQAEDLHRGRQIRATVRLAATPDAAYDAWAEPDLIAGWFVQRAVGRAEAGARVRWIWDDFGVEEEQEVLVAERGRRLVLRAPGPDGGAQVLEVALEADGAGTLLTLVHSGFGEAEDADQTFEGTSSGWNLALGVLAHWCERYYGAARSELMVLRRVPHACAAVQPYFGTPEGLARWLGAAPRSGRELVRGRVESLREWEAVRGTVELKAFADVPDECHVGLRVASWGLEQAELERLRPELEEAVERLVALLG
ncbi:MAG TPA: SRPBCC domain-containing protein [Longimicrobiales bacterium]|nr:SRPBCC domain-containing protein [Longimicrobiales bacterium]